ncbi:hypothetical protein [uncultured Duncaniella sp.]|uniref:hypothetical protein n=1 Tax=uncultured Duncaniella sp. TaxID=2768039 RepID=UPI00267525A2|nr:hypothetical protein [uncultured Duncaniella sp.]
MPRWMPVYEDDMTHWLWDNAQRYQWWLEIRFRAAKTPGMRYVGDTNIRIRVTYGEWPVTIAYLGTRWHADERAIVSFLEALEEDGLITRRKSGLITIISVCGFEKYCFNMERDGSHEAKDNMTKELPDIPQNSIQEDLQEETETQNEMITETADQTLAYLDKRKNIKELFIESKRAHEEEFLEKLKKSDTALTEMAKSLHCDVTDLIPLVDDFSNATISTEDWHSTFSAFKKHFLNWARLRLKTTKNEISTKNQPERGYNTNAGRRRGPITPDCGLNED